jgi:hypothetical protein
MANGNQKPNSHYDAVSTVTHMLLEFENLVLQEMPNTSIVYDQEFSYETGLATFIEKSNSSATQKDPNDLMIYNRTITEDSLQGIASRAKNTTGKLKIDDAMLKYSCAYSEYDLNFLYVNHSLERAEQFETAYNAHSGISGEKELTVNMGDLGEFKYFLNPLPLTDVTITVDSGVTYKGIIGIIRVRGFFFVFEGASGVIQEIERNILSSKNLLDPDASTILSTITIVP